MVGLVLVRVSSTHTPFNLLPTSFTFFPFFFLIIILILNKINLIRSCDHYIYIYIYNAILATHMNQYHISKNL